MRNYYNIGGPTLAGKQNKLPPELKKKILAAKKKKMSMKTAKKDTPRAKAMGGGMMMDRAMYKGGGACKLAMKGKGKAYGKNS